MHEQHLASMDSTARLFLVAILLNAGYVLVEASAGFLTGSLALLSDAGHNLSDVLSLAVAWGASRLSRVEPTSRRTYGWRSSTIMAALVNAVLILLAMGAVGWEAVRRLWSPAPIEATAVLWVAAAGVVVNTTTTLLFLRGRKKDLNVKAAFLHMAADAAVSFGVVLAGALILLTGWPWIDPVVSLLIVLVILLGTGRLVREAGNLALQAVPETIDPDEVRRYLEERPGVTEVHDLHIWAMSTTETALTAHLVKPRVDDDDALLGEVHARLEERFQIDHATIQIERGKSDCRQVRPTTV